MSTSSYCSGLTDLQLLSKVLCAGLCAFAFSLVAGPLDIYINGFIPSLSAEFLTPIVAIVVSWAAFVSLQGYDDGLRFRVSAMLMLASCCLMLALSLLVGGFGLVSILSGAGFGVLMFVCARLGFETGDHALENTGDALANEPGWRVLVYSLILSIGIFASFKTVSVGPGFGLCFEFGITVAAAWFLAFAVRSGNGLMQASAIAVALGVIAISFYCLPAAVYASYYYYSYFDATVVGEVRRLWFLWFAFVGFGLLLESIESNMPNGKGQIGTMVPE